jgi:malonyl-CoA O-methyltransferase
MPEIDPRVARRRFARAAKTYGQAARLEAEIGARMLGRLDYMRIAPRRVLDAGCGPGREARALARRYPRALVLALDFALPMAERAGRHGLLALLSLSRAALAVCADFQRLPLADASVDLVWSNMALHWAADPMRALAEFARVLAPGGLLMLSTLGPETLVELRESAGAEHVHRFADMHDVGDALVGAGLAEPVMDMEKLTLTYAAPAALFADLRASGQTCALAARARGLRGRRFFRALESALAGRMRSGRLAITWEVVYGHAWKGASRPRAELRRPIEVVRRR